MVWSVGSAGGVLGGLHLLSFAHGSVCGISPSTDLRVAFPTSHSHGWKIRIGEN